MRYKPIRRKDGTIYLCPCQLDSATENKIDIKDEIILELESLNSEILEALKIIYKDDYVDGFIQYTKDAKEQMLIKAIKQATGKSIEEVLAEWNAEDK